MRCAHHSIYHFCLSFQILFQNEISFLILILSSFPIAVDIILRALKNYCLGCQSRTLYNWNLIDIFLFPKAIEMKLRTLEYYWLIFTATPTLDIELSVTDNIVFVARDPEVGQRISNEYLDAIMTSVTNTTFSLVDDEKAVFTEGFTDGQCVVELEEDVKSTLLENVQVNCFYVSFYYYSAM